MSAQVLVMCEACHRPQFATQPTCVACGAVLPEEAVSKEQRTGRDKLLEEYQPILEGSLGRGRVLLISDRRLEWTAGRGKKPIFIELSQLSCAELRVRPVWEALLFGLPAVVGALATQRSWLHALFALQLLASLGAVAWVRRFALRLTRNTGQTAELVLALGTHGSPAGRAAKSVWASFREELAGHGVATP